MPTSNADGRRVLGLAESRRRLDTYEASVHGKYVEGLRLPDRRSSNAGPYACFAASRDFIAAYLSSLDLILSNASRYPKPEGQLEEKLIRCSLRDDSPVIFIDRQVQVHGVRSRADLIGIAASSDSQARVVLVELKQGPNNRIQYLANQMSSYREVFAPGGHLAADVAASYREVVAQKQELGILPAAACFPEGDPAVDCLLVLADYNPRSRLLGRLRERSRSSDFGMRLALLEPGTFILPPPESWEVL